MHTHEFPEICIVLKGKIIHVVNGSDVLLDAGSIVFIRPGDTHCYRSCESSECELVTVAFDLKYLVDLSRYLEEREMMRIFTACVLPPVYHLSPAETEKSALKLLNINSLQITDINSARTEIKAVIAGLFISTFLEHPPEEKITPVPEWLVNLCRQIKAQKDFSAGIRLLYDAAPCTKEHLCYCFRKYMNMTPTDFLNDCRMVQAAEMLLESDETVYAVSLNVGINSQRHFYKLFRKKYGMSPGRFREVYKKNNIPVGY
jgi:AraC family cel operon transcriptional repressor